MSILADIECIKYCPEWSSPGQNGPASLFQVTGKIFALFNDYQDELSRIARPWHLPVELDQPGPIGRKLKAKRKGRRRQAKASQKRNRK